MDQRNYTQEHYEIVIRIGETERVVPARVDGIDGTPWVLHYGDKLQHMTSGWEGLASAEHMLTRAALNEMNRLLEIARGGGAYGLPARPLGLGESLSVQIRKRPDPRPATGAS